LIDSLAFEYIEIEIPDGCDYECDSDTNAKKEIDEFYQDHVVHVDFETHFKTHFCYREDAINIFDLCFSIVDNGLEIKKVHNNTVMLEKPSALIDLEDFKNEIKENIYISPDCLSEDIEHIDVSYESIIIKY